MNRKASVLIVEDNPVFAKVLAMLLEKANYHCTTTGDISIFQNLLREGPVPDMFIFDYDLGAEMNGIELCELVKSRHRRPVIMLTANDSEEISVASLYAGADQHIVKPYRINELLARIRATILNYSSCYNSLTPMPESSQITLDSSLRLLKFNDKKVMLTEKEIQLYELLMSNLGMALKREVIYFNVFGGKSPTLSRRVDVLVGRLRKKLRASDMPLSIVQSRNHGYMLTMGSHNLNIGHENATADL